MGQEVSGGWIRRQRPSVGLPGGTSGAIASVPGSWGEPLLRSALSVDESVCKVSARERRRLPGHALVELEIGRGLSENVPVRDRLGSLVPGGPRAGAIGGGVLGNAVNDVRGVG